MSVNWLDALLVAILFACIAVGFFQGLVRQLILLLAVYLSAVLSAQYYDRASALLAWAVPSVGPGDASLIAFLLLFLGLTTTITGLAWSAYREVRLPAAVVVDNLGGAVLGAAVGISAIAITLILAQYATQIPWPEGSSIASTLMEGLGGSTLRGLFAAPAPLVQAVLGSWLPPSILGG